MELEGLANGEEPRGIGCCEDRSVIAASSLARRCKQQDLKRDDIDIK